MQLHHAKILHCNNRAFDSKRKKTLTSKRVLNEMILQLNSERKRKRKKNEQETIQLTFLNRAFAFTVGSYIVLLIVVLLSDVLPTEHV